MTKKEAMELAARELAREGEEVLDAAPSGASMVAFLQTEQGEFVISAARIQVLLGKASPVEGEPFRFGFDHRALAQGRYQEILRNLQ
jgi:hypothetical protein